MKANYIVRRYLYYLAQNVEYRGLTGIEAPGRKASEHTPGTSSWGRQLSEGKCRGPLLSPP